MTPRWCRKLLEFVSFFIILFQPSLWFHRNEVADMLIKQLKSFSKSLDFKLLVFLKNISEWSTTLIYTKSQKRNHESQVPARWKQGLIIPSLKKYRTSGPKNYRPISILHYISVLVRVFEKIVKKNIMEHLLEQHIISENQFHFPKRKCFKTSAPTSSYDRTCA